MDLSLPEDSFHYFAGEFLVDRLMWYMKTIAISPPPQPLSPSIDKSITGVFPCCIPQTVGVGGQCRCLFVPRSSYVWGRREKRKEKVSIRRFGAASA